ncbi:unnamed protein product [Paramecium primaurelia]|uniref:Protein kinase domain-containing protein n=1 Tax=Paramecium primaurelia TaxID=5886 RepID=A0A8S1N6T8_PARPR|nr:unnamed protein product [Paramecium primaurelia]
MQNYQISIQIPQIQLINLVKKHFEMIKDLNPSSEYKHSKSFFQISYSTMQWSKSPLPISINNQTISDEVKFVNKSGVVKSTTLTNIENYLFYKTKKGKTKWIDIENAIIELFYHPKFGSALRLIKCFDVIEIFCDSKSWLGYLKSYTIQCDFDATYIIKKKIGKGSLSQVYKGFNKYDGNEYAVKIYKKQSLIDEAHRIALLKRTSIHRRVQSEFAIKFYEIFENSEQVFIILELITCGNLMDYMAREICFQEDRAAKIIFRLVKTINYLHSKNIIYRDLKPDNIVFRIEDNIETLCIRKFQLADFYDPELNYHYVCCGTPGFIAPEILLHQNYDLKVDVFSIGVILYILTTGTLPFDGNTDSRLQQNIEGEVDLNSVNLSPLGLDFIIGTLQSNPEERLTSHQCLNHQWFIQEQLAKLKQMQMKKPTILQNRHINRRIKQSKTLTFSPSSPRSHVSIQSPKNHNLQQNQHFPLKIPQYHTEKLIGPSYSSKNINKFEKFQTQPPDDDSYQDESSLKASFQSQMRLSRKKTESFVIKSNSTAKQFNATKSKFK